MREVKFKCNISHLIGPPLQTRITRDIPVKTMLFRHSAVLRRTSTHRPISSRSISSRPLRLAIIGAGPSGFYTASKILQTLPIGSEHGDQVEVHMYDRLPTPYGLARYGVAPDHPEVKVRLGRG